MFCFISCLLVAWLATLVSGGVTACADMIFILGAQWFPRSWPSVCSPSVFQHKYRCFLTGPLISSALVGCIFILEDIHLIARCGCVCTGALLAMSAASRAADAIVVWKPLCAGAILLGYHRDSADYGA
jgi:hypothetical protein